MNVYKRISGLLPVDAERKRRCLTELARRGLTITRVAQLIGVSRQYASAVISGRKPYRDAEVKIAALLGLPVSYLFPARTAADITRMRAAEDALQEAG